MVKKNQTINRRNIFLRKIKSSLKLDLHLTYLKIAKIPKINKLASKVALGAFLLFFLLDYQPTLQFPPLKHGEVRAQSEQTQKISTASLPLEFQLPHPGYLSTSYSSYHPGLDIATGLGMPIKPVAEGKVVDTGFNFWGLGMIVEIDHNHGFKSLYAHMGKIYVKKGQEVDKNSLLGEVGLTGNTSGPHTHLEVNKDGQKVDPQLILPKIRTQPIVDDFKPVKAQGGRK